MRLSALALGLPLLAAPPKDPCTLLKPAEVQTVDPKAKIGAGVSSTVSAAVGSFACTYKWDAGSKSRSGKLDVIISDASKMYPGTDLAMVKQGLVRIAKNDTNAAVVPGVGDAAVFETHSQYSIKVTALAKGSIVALVLELPDPRARKAELIALLKAAVGRL